MNLETIKIGILGSFAHGDTGDDAMVTPIVDYLLNEVGIREEQLCFFASDPRLFEKQHSYRKASVVAAGDLITYHNLTEGSMYERCAQIAKCFVGRRSIYNRKLVEQFKSCDLAVYTGGGTINYRDPKIRSLRRTNLLSLAFAKKGKPVFMSGQTIGPLGQTLKADKLAREIVDSVSYLGVRDQGYSRRYIEVIGAKPNAFYEGLDDASTLSEAGGEFDDDLLHFIDKGDYAAFNVTEYTASSNKDRFFAAKIVEHIIRTHDLNVVLVSHARVDLTNHFSIFDLLPEDIKNRAMVPVTIDRPASLLKNIIKGAKFAVGGRYHFIVFAGTSKIPFIGMCGNHYSYIKQHGFAQQLGRGAYILSEADTWDMDTIETKIAGIMEGKDKDWGSADLEYPTGAMKNLKQWLAEKTANLK